MNDGDTSHHLRAMIRDDETLLWSTKPHRRGWYAGNVVGLTLGMGLFAGIFGAFAGLAILGDETSTFPLGAGGTAVLVLGGLLALALGGAILAHAMYRHAELALTDDRLIRLGGLVGRDASAVSLEDVRDVEVRVFPLDKLFGTGRIRVKTAGGADSGLRMGYVADPYGTLEQIEGLRAQAAGEAG